MNWLKLPFRLLALAISMACWALMWTSSRLGRLFGRARPRCVALYYHAVRREEREKFAWQMEELLRISRPVHPDATCFPANECGRYSMVTFDDGFRCVAENAVPELVRRGIPAALFVPAGCLGGNPAWLAGTSHPDIDEPVLSVEDLRALPHEVIRIGSHSLDHVALTSLREEELRRQLVESRARLEHIVGRPVQLLSAPHGEWDVRVLELAREAGYSRVFTIEPSLTCLDDGRLSHGRFRTSPHDWRLEFRLKLLGAYCWLPVGRSFKRWLATRLGGRSVRCSKT